MGNQLLLKPAKDLFSLAEYNQKNPNFLYVLYFATNKILNEPKETKIRVYKTFLCIQK